MMPPSDAPTRPDPIPTFRVATVIVSHSAIGLARQSAELLVQHGFPVVIVRTRGTVAPADDLPWLELSLPNVGYGVAANVGAKTLDAAGDRPPEWIFILNDDVTLTAEAVSRLCSRLADTPSDIGCVAPEIVGEGVYADRVVGLFPGVHALVRTLLTGERSAVRRLPDETYPIGSALLIRRIAWEGVQGFAPAFFLYWEETDLIMRLRGAGWRTGHLAGVSVHHVGETSTSEYGYLRSGVVFGQSFARYCSRNSIGLLAQILWILLQLRNTILLIAHFRLRRAGRPLGSLFGYAATQADVGGDFARLLGGVNVVDRARIQTSADRDAP